MFVAQKRQESVTADSKLGVRRTHTFTSSHTFLCAKDDHTYKIWSRDSHRTIVAVVYLFRALCLILSSFKHCATMHLLFPISRQSDQKPGDSLSAWTSSLSSTCVEHQLGGVSSSITNQLFLKLQIADTYRQLMIIWTLCQSLVNPQPDVFLYAEYK